MTRRNRVLSALTFCAVVLAGAARLLADHTNGWLPFAVLGAALVVCFGLPPLIRRRNTKARAVIAAAGREQAPPDVQ